MEGFFSCSQEDKLFLVWYLAPQDVDSILEVNSKVNCAFWTIPHRAECFFDCLHKWSFKGANAYPSELIRTSVKLLFWGGWIFSFIGEVTAPLTDVTERPVSLFKIYSIHSFSCLTWLSKDTRHFTSLRLPSGERLVELNTLICLRFWVAKLLKMRKISASDIWATVAVDFLPKQSQRRCREWRRKSCKLGRYCP